MPAGPPNLSGVVLSFSTPGTRIRRSGLTTNADGFRVSATEERLATRGHLFPASGDLLQRFQLQDMAGLWELHTTTQMRSASEVGQTQADRWEATVGGVCRSWEVVQAGPWLEGPAGSESWTAAVLREVV